jgi:hypothetical protein
MKEKLETYRSPTASQCDIPNGLIRQHSSNLDVLGDIRFTGVSGKEYQVNIYIVKESKCSEQAEGV